MKISITLHREFSWKSVSEEICRSYDQKSNIPPFFWTWCTCTINVLKAVYGNSPTYQLAADEKTRTLRCQTQTFMGFHVVCINTSCWHTYKKVAQGRRSSAYDDNCATCVVGEITSLSASWPFGELVRRQLDLLPCRHTLFTVSCYCLLSFAPTFCVSLFSWRYH